MTRARLRLGSRRWTLWLGAGVVLVLGGSAAAAVAPLTENRSAASERQAAERAHVTMTPAGTVVARTVDRRRGLVFVVESSADFGDSALYVTLTRNAPASTRRALLEHPLVGTCAVPGEHVREFAGRWDPRFRRYGTALLTDNPGVVIARKATSCALYVGRKGATPDLAVFPERPFSHVRLR